MRIVVEVSPNELQEMNVTVEELKWNVVEDLDKSRDYSGYNVDVISVDPDTNKMTLSRCIDHVRFFSEL